MSNNPKDVQISEEDIKRNEISKEKNWKYSMIVVESIGSLLNNEINLAIDKKRRDYDELEILDQKLESSGRDAYTTLSLIVRCR